MKLTIEQPISLIALFITTWSVISVNMRPSQETRYYGYMKVLFAIMYFHAKCMGVISYTFDSKTNAVKRCRFSFWYGIVVFCVMCGFIASLLCMSFPDTGQWSAIYGKNQIMLLISAFNGLVFHISVTFIVVYNVVFYDEILELGNTIVFLNTKYFQIPPEAAQKKMFIYCLLKHLSASIFNIRTIIRLCYSKGTMELLYVYTTTMVFNIVESSLSMVFLSILLITKFYQLLNSQLRELIEDINRSHKLTGLTYLKDKVTELSYVFTKVYQTHKLSFKMTQITVCSILVTNYINNIVRAYDLYNSVASPSGSLLKQSLLIVSVITHWFDILIFIQVCHENVETWKDSRRTLSSITLCQGVDLDLQRSVSILVLSYPIIKMT